MVEANGLEGALLLDSRLRVVLDPSGPADRPVDLLRVDVGRVRRALAGEDSLSLGWAIGEARVASAFLPVRHGGAVDRVLVLEAGFVTEQSRDEVNALFEEFYVPLAQALEERS